MRSPLERAGVNPDDDQMRVLYEIVTRLEQATEHTFMQAILKRYPEVMQITHQFSLGERDVSYPGGRRLQVILEVEVMFRQEQSPETN